MTTHSITRADITGPEPAEVQLWLLDFEQSSFLQLSPRQLVMSADEHHHAQRLSSSEVRSHYAITRTLVRQVLSFNCPSVAPLDWQFARNTHGKPFIGSPSQTPPLYFNVSHCRDRVVLAIGRWPELGVDIERLAPHRNVLGLARRYFCPQEFADLRDREAADRLTQFYRLWTLKEAFSKARGGALVPALSQLQVQLPEEGQLVASVQGCTGPADDWRFWVYADSGHRLAVALSGPGPQVAVNCRLRTVSVPWQLEVAEASSMVLECCRG